MSSEAANRPLLLDTHVWLWLVMGNASLKGPSREAVRQAVGRGALRISAISVWEVALLAARGRIVLGMPTLEWMERSLAASQVELEPLTPAVSVDGCTLPAGLHNDPADRIIVATARVTDAILMTRDRRILDYAALGHLAALPA